MTLMFSQIPKFKKEIKMFEEKILYLKNNKIKNQARILLDELYNEARILDDAYSTSNNIKITPNDFKENIENTLEIRRKLYKILQ